MGKCKHFEINMWEFWDVKCTVWDKKKKKTSVAFEMIYKENCDNKWEFWDSKTVLTW